MLKKPIIILTSMLLAGGLITAIGVGVAFAQYMNFEYDYTTLAAKSERTTASYEVILKDNERLEIATRDYEVITDENVAPGTIETITEYNPAFIEPRFQTYYNCNYDGNNYNYSNYGNHNGNHYNQSTPNSANGSNGPSSSNGVTDAQPVITLSISSTWLTDEGELFMQNKDVILEGLKNHVLIAPQYDTEMSTVIKVNPADQSKIL